MRSTIILCSALIASTTATPFSLPEVFKHRKNHPNNGHHEHPHDQDHHFEGRSQFISGPTRVTQDILQFALKFGKASVPQIPGLPNFPVTTTYGGHASCIQGNISVTITAENNKLNCNPPANSTELSNTALSYMAAGSTLPEDVLGAESSVTGTYNINSKICFPKSGVDTTLPLHFLIHGVGFDKSYWDFYSSQYSYADYMAQKGYTTFMYDRLGCGLSDHPDPLQIVQSPFEVNIAHALIQGIRSAKIGNQQFSKIVGVGHSFGSFQVNGITKDHPTDLDAAILTGFSIDQNGVGAFLSSLNLDIASSNQPSRFGGLANGYTCSSSQISNQLAFFSWPGFDPAVLVQAEKAKQTFALGELFTLGGVSGPAPNFKGPVDVVLGMQDLPFCQSNCMEPSNQAVTVLQELYPNIPQGAGSQNYLAPGCGHAVNLHYGAQGAYSQMVSFLKANGM